MDRTAGPPGLPGRERSVKEFLAEIGTVLETVSYFCAILDPDMYFIDTHTHLYDEQFSEDAGAAVGRAAEAGVRKMILPDIDRNSREAMFSLAEKFSGTLFPCLGLHPTSVGPGWEEELEEIEGMAMAGKGIRAIGETGMDCYWSKEFLKEQEEAFERQIRLACRLGLPVIVHCREATEPIFNVLGRCRHLSPAGVFHAFSGSIETYRRLAGYGDWYVGIGGVVTFRKASIAETVRQIPLGRILLETDSPYLTPVPHRGERNESAYIPLIAEKIAAQKNISIEEVAGTTSRNAEELFGI